MTPSQAEKLRKHVIVALDLDNRQDALALVESLFPMIDKFKIGSRMFTAFGPELINDIGRIGASVFLDLKYHDIPSVVGRACAVAAEHEHVFLLTVHALGGARMVAEAVAGAARNPNLKVIAVTALTSHSAGEIHTLGVSLDLEQWAEKLAALATEAGAHGLVCSPHELARLRAVTPSGCIFVTPGIRGAESRSDDQTRVMTAAEALSLGGSYLVIGRPIYAASDPLDAAQRIGATL